MKFRSKILCLLLTVILMAGVFFVMPVEAEAAASGTCGDSLNWTVSDSGVLYISGTGKMTSYTASSPAPWNAYAANITSVNIGSGVTSIGAYAFVDFTSLKTITIPNSVTFIGGSALRGCSALQSVTLPFIGQTADPVSAGKQYPFGFIFGSTSFSGSTATGQYYYWGENRNAQTYYIPDSLKTVRITGGNIVSEAFIDCANLTSITLPNNITTIDRLAFYGCSSLTSINIPSTVTTICDAAFYQCASLKDLVLPSGLTELGTHALYDCTALTGTITVPSGVTEISQGLFYRCSGLTKINLPANVTSIGSSAFLGCTGWTGTLKIPSKVTSISNNAFYGCKKLTQIIIPDGVTTIGNYAFQNTAPASVIFEGNAPTTISSNAFSNVTTTVLYPGSGSGWADAITSSYGGKLTWVSCKAAGNCGENLTWVLDNAGKLTISGTGDMDDYDFDNEKVDNYSPWYDYRDSITSVVVESGVTSLGNEAFRQCKNLVTISVPSSVTSYGYGVFWGCNALKDFTWPAGDTSIGGFTFAGCSSLTDITIPSCVTAIADNAFAGVGITSLTIPDTVTRIGNRAFSGCSSLTEVTIGKGLTFIGAKAFNVCNKLRTVTFTGSAPRGSESNSFFQSYGGPVCYYPADDSSWTASARTLICSYSTWKAYCNEHTFGDPVYTWADDHSTCTATSTCVNGCGTTGNTETATAAVETTEAGCITEGKTVYTATFTTEGFETQTFTETIPGSGKHTFNTLTHKCECGMIGGNCGLGVSWTLYDGVLTVFCPSNTNGAGDMYSYSTDNTPWNLYKSSIKTLVVEEGVLSIGSYAFYGTSLTSLTLPNTVTRLGNHAFSECDQLTQVTLPDTITTMEYSVFSNCSKLATVTLPSKLEEIAYSAFYNCTSLTSIQIPDSVTSIGSQAFMNCTALTEIDLPSVVTVYSRAFYNCANLESVGRLEVLTTLETSAFEGCTSLKEVDMPSIVTIGNSAFNGCETLETVTFGDSLTAINSYAFNNCNLRKIVIGKSVTNIASCAFADNRNVQTIVLFNTTDIIQSNAFKGTVAEDIYCAASNLWFSNAPEGKYIHCSTTSEEGHWTTKAVDATCQAVGYTTEACACGYERNIVTGTELGNHNYENSQCTVCGAIGGKCGGKLTWTLEDGLLTISGTGTITSWADDSFTPWYKYQNNITTVVLELGVTAIGENAFRDCTNLTSVTIPTSVTSIGDYAFSYCQNITTIIIPDGVSSIGEGAFSHCDLLTNISLSRNVTIIDDYAFYSCKNLTNIAIPASTNYVGFSAFSNCNSLRDVYYGKERWTFAQTGISNDTVIHCSIENPASHWSTEVVGASCTEAGYTIDVCGCKYTRNMIATEAALGHDWSQWTINEATCTVDGEKFRECIRNNCDEIESEVLKANGHSYDAVITAPTCTEKGYTTYTCHCGDTYTADEVPETGHSMGNWEETVAPTCTKAGTERSDCGNCDHYETRAVAKLAHAHRAVITMPTCTKQGYTKHICACGDTYTDTYVDALGHTGGTATCNATAICTRCKTAYGTLDAKNHAGGTELRNQKAATCTAAGYTGDTHCLGCGAKTASGKTLAMVAHSYWNGECKVCEAPDPDHVPLAITTQPKTTYTKQGSTVKVTVAAKGDGVTYNWYLKKAGESKYTKTSVTSSTYSVKMDSTVKDGRVLCIVRDKYGNKMESKSAVMCLAATITQQPVNTAAQKGEKLTVQIKAVGDGLTYTWYYKNPGATKFSKTSTFTGNTYSISTMDAERSGRQVYCKVTDKYGKSVTTNTVTLSMMPAITTQPKTVYAKMGTSARATVAAEGEGLTYQWYVKSAGSSSYSKSSVTGSAYSVKMSNSSKDRRVYCVITDKYGNKVQTNTVYLRLAATVTVQPKSVTVGKGETAKISFTAVGDDLKYEWYYKNPGAAKFSKTSTFTGNTYTISSMTADRSGRQIYCKVTDKYGKTIKTNTVTITME